MFDVTGKQINRSFVLLAALLVALAVVWLAGAGTREAEAQTGKVPLILAPGVGGSFIMDGSTEKWPNADRMALSLSDEFLMDLALRSDGTEDPNRDYRVGDILRKAPVNLLPDPNVYQTTVDKLQAAGYRENVDFFVYPYDWRKDVRGNNGSGDIDFIRFIDNVRANTGAQKVDVMAHSMGGMVTLAALEDTRSVGKIRKVMTMGTPVLGATQALGLLQYRMPCFLDPFGLCILNKETAQKLFNNFPGGYQLMPSPAFDKAVGAPLLIDWDKNGDGVKDGLQGYGKWSSIVRASHNGALLDLAKNYHYASDTLTLADPNVKLTRVVADGSGTPGGIREYKDCFLWYFSCDVEHEILNTNGDATVPLHSADLYNPNTGFDRRGPGRNVYFSGVSHGDLVKNDAVMDYAIAYFNTSMTTATISTQSVSAQGVESDFSLQPEGFDGIELETIGPVSGYVEDGSGNTLGEATELPAGSVEEIPGGSYNEITDTKTFFLNDGGSYEGNFEVTNTDSMVRFRVRGYEGSELRRQAVFFAGVPEGSDVKISFDKSSNFKSLRLLVDKNGDGKTDEKLSPASTVAGPAASDRNAPESRAKVGKVRGNKKKVTLSAGDKAEGSGVSSIKYVLGSEKGEKAKIRTYKKPFMVPEGVTVQFLALDQAGNAEPVERIASGGR